MLDPFGASPRLALEVARAGYRLLVAANNPVTRFLLEMVAQPPGEAELRAALAELAAAFKGEERIEPHIRSLYETECAACGQTVTAEAFLWERQGPTLYGRIYHCANCGDAGERPASENDINRAAHLAAGLHRARALERVAPVDDPNRAHAEEALDAYLPRAVYALFTLINKLDGLSLSPPRRACLNALLLTACDQANTLWAYPTARERPKQLGVPNRFRENNVWLALEAALNLWASFSTPDQPPVPLTFWPEWPPESGGVCLFEGRLKDLAPTLASVEIGAVATALPRPNQAFWTLSALWAGWLWGREAVQPFRGALQRRRYDWGWHATALTAAMSSLAPALPAHVPILGLIGENEPGFLSAALIAADAAGLDLQSVALREEGGLAQMIWQREAKAAEIAPPEGSGQSVGRSAAAQYLAERGEPAGYTHMHAAALAGMAQAHVFRAERAFRAVQEALTRPETAAEPKVAVVFSAAHNAVKEMLTYRGNFLRYQSSDAPESGLWWLRTEDTPENCALPLADRLEKALVSHVLKNPGCTLDELDWALRQTFPGLQTPDSELIENCLDSYAEQEPLESGHWKLRPQDSPAARRADLQQTRELLRDLAQRLGFSVAGDFPLVWMDTASLPRYHFYPQVSALLGQALLRGGSPAERSLIVLPGSRGNLLAYKLKRDPHLQQVVDEGWRFLKFRHLRQLCDTAQISAETLDEQLSLDPLTYSAPQMRLI